MSKFWQEASFKKLLATWDKKLEKSGFNDKEQSDGNLKEWHSLRFQPQYYVDSIPARTKYYRMAGNFLHEYSFSTELEKTIWKMHSEGCSFEEIDDHIGYKYGKARRVIEKLLAVFKTFNFK